jgi:hypothetical protein
MERGPASDPFFIAATRLFDGTGLIHAVDNGRFVAPRGHIFFMSWKPHYPSSLPVVEELKFVFT